MAVESSPLKFEFTESYKVNSSLGIIKTNRENSNSKSNNGQLIPTEGAECEENLQAEIWFIWTNLIICTTRNLFHHFLAQTLIWTLKLKSEYINLFRLAKDQLDCMRHIETRHQGIRDQRPPSEFLITRELDMRCFIRMKGCRKDITHFIVVLFNSFNSAWKCENIINCQDCKNHS